jgi:hypothetical protein
MAEGYFGFPRFTSLGPLVEEDEDMLYHATDEGSIPSILKNGIIPSDPRKGDIGTPLENAIERNRPNDKPSRIPAVFCKTWNMVLDDDIPLIAFDPDETDAQFYQTNVYQLQAIIRAETRSQEDESAKGMWEYTRKLDMGLDSEIWTPSKIPTKAIVGVVE